MEIAAYIFGGIGILVNLLVYQQNTSKRVLLFKLASNIIWSVYYILVGAYTALGVTCVAIARETTFIAVDRKSKKGIACLGLFAATSIVCSILTWKTPLSILPAVASITAVFSFYFSIPSLSRVLALPVLACMGIYDVSAGAWLAFANEIITTISVITAIIMIDILKKAGKAKIPSV